VTWCRICDGELDGERGKSYCSRACRATGDRVDRGVLTLEAARARFSPDRHCEWCEDSTRGRRSDARFCCRPCKAAWHRHQRALDLAGAGKVAPFRESAHRGTRRL
jgi:hypothetical protein